VPRRNITPSASEASPNICMDSGRRAPASDVSDPCRHTWSESYVCTACGSIKSAKIPFAVLCEPIQSGPRNVYLALWSFADHDTTAPLATTRSRPVCFLCWDRHTVSAADPKAVVA
jgi:hypothetical protein